jgi:hypothetical protein
MEADFSYTLTEPKKSLKYPPISEKATRLSTWLSNRKESCMKQDRFLIGIFIGIFILVATALTLFFVHKGKQGYGPEDSPAGIVRNYILAIDKEDYERAYRYLADLPHKPTYATFLAKFPLGWPYMDDGRGVEINKTTIYDEQATVELHIIYDSGDPFYTRYQSSDKALLIRQNGAWKIKDMTWEYWRWDWYHDP